MKILKGIAPETTVSVPVLRGGKEVDRFDVVFSTPNDAQSDAIMQARLAVLQFLNKGQRGEIDLEKLPDERAKLRRDADFIIDGHFIRFDGSDYASTKDEEYETVRAMLSHDIYRGALLLALWNITTGESTAKNSKTPVTSGQPANSPEPEKTTQND